MCQRHPWTSNASAQFHMRDHSCMVGDPNEPVYDPVHGLYHLFYQVKDGRFPGSPSRPWPNHTVQGPIQGHAVSYDLVRWAHLPIALWNSEPYESVAVYTGSATVVNGTVALVYPGVCAAARPDDPQPIWPPCSSDSSHHYSLVLARPAEPGDPLLRRWRKELLLNNTERDPSGAWRTSDGEWRFVTWDGWVYGSYDFLRWQKNGELAGVPNGDCPSLFPRPNATTAEQRTAEQRTAEQRTAEQLAAAVNASAEAASRAAPSHVYKVSFDNHDYAYLGNYDSGGGGSPGVWSPSEGLPLAVQRLDVGVYASKSFWDPLRARRVMWGVVSDSRSNAFTLPRVVTWDDALQQLVFAPIPELAALRLGCLANVSAARLTPGEPVSLGPWSGELGGGSQAEVELTFVLAALSHAATIEVVVRRDARRPRLDSMTFALHYRPPVAGIAHRVEVTATHAATRHMWTDSLALLPHEERLSLRIFIDHTLVEVYWQGGRVAMTVPFATSDAAVLGVQATEKATLESARVWRLGTVFVTEAQVLAAGATRQAQSPEADGTRPE